MASIPESITALNQQLGSLRSLIQGSRDQGMWYSFLGNQIVYGCKVVPASGMFLGLTGLVDHINPDYNAAIIRPEQYPNIANVYGEVFLMPEQNLPTINNTNLEITNVPATGVHRYDVVYIYVGVSGPSVAITKGTPVATGITPAVPTIPQGSVSIAKVLVVGGSTSISAGDITDTRNFTGRLTGTQGVDGTNAGVVIPLTSNPLPTDGVNNDCALNTTTGDFFQKVGGIWQLKGNIKGAKGDTGLSGSVAIGTTSTGAAGTSAAVTNTGTPNASILNFTIPQGVQGVKGDTGTNAGVVIPLTTDPTTQGVNNDCALNTVSGDFFQKVGGSWVLKGNIKGPAGTVSDGDKGDITVSVSGTVFTIDSNVLSTFGRSITSAADAAAVKTTLSLGNVNNTSDTSKPVSTAQQTALDLKANLTTNTFTGVQTFNAAIREGYAAISANDIDLTLDSYYSKTISGATTLTVSNTPSAGVVSSFVLELTNGGSATVTWWSGIKWAGGTAPALTASGVDILGFYTRDGGTTWRGLVLAKDSK